MSVLRPQVGGLSTNWAAGHPETESSWWSPSGCASHCPTAAPPQSLEHIIHMMPHTAKSKYAHHVNTSTNIFYTNVFIKLQNKFNSLYIYLHKYMTCVTICKDTHDEDYYAMCLMSYLHNIEAIEPHDRAHTIHTRAFKLNTHSKKKNSWSPPSCAVFTWLFFYLELNCQIDHSEVQHTCGSTKKAR